MKPLISGPAHQQLHADPGAEADAGDPGGLGLGMDLLDPVERAGGVGQLADAVVEHALALADAAEIEAQRREAAADEGLVEQLDDLVVHRPAGLRVRVEDHRDRRARARARVETAFEAAFGTGKMTSGMIGGCSRKGLRRRGCAAAAASYIGERLQQAIGSYPRKMTDRIYLDHAATTPVLPEAREAMAEALEHWANPSSPHAEGPQGARRARGGARRASREALGWRHDVIFTSGASEAIAIVAARAKVERRLVGATEHAIVPHAMGEGAGVHPGRCRRPDRPGCARRALAARRRWSRSSRSITRPA